MTKAQAKALLIDRIKWYADQKLDAVRLTLLHNELLQNQYQCSRWDILELLEAEIQSGAIEAKVNREAASPMTAVAWPGLVSRKDDINGEADDGAGGKMAPLEVHLGKWS